MPIDRTAVRANVGGGPKRGGTSPVDAHPGGASPYGLLDMAGNVWEWVGERLRDRTRTTRPTAARTRPRRERVLRGGSYASPAAPTPLCRAEPQLPRSPLAPHIGFRIARDIAIDHATDDRSQP